MSPALVFDCDGVLADTERDGHRPAFNATFEAVGLPVRWDVETYGRYLTIGGGKERMAALLTDELVAANGLPTDPEGQRALLADWHRRKTDTYVGLVESGALPGRPGVARIVAEAAAAGWRLAVASTSADRSVRAVLDHAVGTELAERFSVFAGDAVAAKKPAPDIYLLALDRLGVAPTEAVAVEDSPNGMRAALAAGLPTVVTVSTYTVDEDFTGAALVVSSLGDPGTPADVLSDPHHLGVTDQVTLAHLSRLVETTKERAMAIDLARIEHVVKIIAQTAVDNETYFGDLDSVVGDGDFGYSLARGFELVLQDWDELDRTDAATFLQKVAMIVTSRVGGTSGPIWGTSFLRASMVARTAETLDGATVVAMLDAAVEGIKARGGAEVGDKTLLDALVPMRETIAAKVAEGAGSGEVAKAAAERATEAAEATKGMQAMRGRASYTGERSIGSVDAGATAVAVIAGRIADQWSQV
ncbi:MAG TPA: dihydroxyacetone kinase subunit DhaL [Actinotalea sp.]|nr:dihydroxyacetone kinase subunit DhaL [Actinotalea sp.]